MIPIVWSNNLFNKSTTKTSIEKRLVSLFILSIVLPLIPCFYIIIYQDLEPLEIFTLLLVFLLPGFWLFVRGYRSVTDVLERIGLQLDALGNEEYNSWHLAGYEGGRVESLKRDFTKLGLLLANKRLEYLHNESFLADFIKELDLPILVLDHHQNIYSSNSYFNQLLSVDTSQLLGKSPKTLGLVLKNNRWLQENTGNSVQRFEISHHVFKRSGRNFQLLVLFSIEQQLRENEKLVWQRLIRVLNHEVRNSLTPIYSMSQSLQTMKSAGSLSPEQQQIEKNILEVIEQRAQHLLSFVDSYSAFSKLAPAKMSQISSDEVNKRLNAIFPHIVIDSSDHYSFSADIGQLEQALINLIKNAFEASTNEAKVTLSWHQRAQQIEITILDTGTGISNIDNLFVPFYSTKEGGSGIGLILSRELIRNQGGELTLANRDDCSGARASICLKA